MHAQKINATVEGKFGSSMGRTKCDHSSSFAVAYTTDQLLYDWKSVAEPVEYDKTLKLSQFEKHETFIRSLNFSRNETSMSSLLVYKQRALSSKIAG